MKIKPVLLADWADGSIEDVAASFQHYQQTTDLIAGYDVLLAYYSYEDYSGSAFVLLHKDGQLFEVNGSHCSCFGLEDQWEPEQTTVESLQHRLDHGTLGKDYYRSENHFANELRAVLAQLASGAGE